jgi:hypothetical protein
MQAPICDGPSKVNDTNKSVQKDCKKHKRKTIRKWLYFIIGGLAWGFTVNRIFADPNELGTVACLLSGMVAIHFTCWGYILLCRESDSSP